ncbi:UvrD-helicase domain-containing protein [Exiguobacterium sp. s160]|uniref:UvrD-helicase domain-containing protein n=1 Tax=Exiguobacterium sp. s160 TaxID=2751265 RepID=UPI001BE6963B|nr:UvrD-helicase domain-containing protein [Exiguobacterium sp. s160]
MGWYAAIKRTYWTWRLSSEIRREIKRMEVALESLSKITNHLRERKTPISQYEIEENLSPYTELHDSCIKGEILSKLDMIQTSIEQTTSKQTRPLATLEADYRKKLESFLFELNNLHLVAKEVNQQLERYYRELINFQEEIEQLKRNYIGDAAKRSFQEKYRDVEAFFKGTDIEHAQSFLLIFADLETSIRTWNEEFVVREMSDMKHLFDDIDGKSLDLQQRKAVVVDEDANLVVAGAGSGKTLTISAKVKYLVDRKGIRPEEILLISFTNKSAEEMEERIKNRLGISVDVKTFHGLGMGIISKHTKMKPQIEDNLHKIIMEYCKQEFYRHPLLLRKLIEFFGYYLHIPKGVGDFDTLGEYHEYHKHLDFKTLKNLSLENKYIDRTIAAQKRQNVTIRDEKVKSLEEVMIANFLFLHGIKYEYEADYEHRTADEFHRQYQPDFYLPEYGIYIEHFGVDKNQRAKWLSQIEEMKYIDGMEWKRALHEVNETTLIETYSYYTSEGRLLEQLEKKLRRQGVLFKEVEVVEIFNRLYDFNKKSYFEEFVKFTGTFLTLFKSNGYKEEQLDKFVSGLDSNNPFLYQRTKLFLEIFRPIYKYYEQQLRQSNQIDFNDMIIEATSLVKSGQVNLEYRYIIIDEFQDISLSRFRLVEAIRHMANARVMCVGDDWQSIYRFTGADLSLFIDFERYFGKSEILKIERTYRNSRELINVAGTFIMKNGKQIRKDLSSSKRTRTPIRILGFKGKSDLVQSLTRVIEDIVLENGEVTSLFLIGRNNFDIKFLEHNAAFRVSFSKKGADIVYEKHPKLQISFLTAHSSKGLEAENVVLVNAENGIIGFPNKMVDDPLLSLVLQKQEELEFGEERRLFYVALTRTKNVTYILTPNERMSVFVKELIREQEVPYYVATENGDSTKTQPTCPRCIEGRLVIRESKKKNRPFLGCSHYPTCSYTVKDMTILHNPIICPSCEGYMVLRSSKNGKFYGCSNYPDCQHTMPMTQ